MAGEPLVTIIGNLVADPEPRVSQAGKSWCTFRIASTPRVQDRQSNEWTDGTALWLGCRAYGELADNIVASLNKGNRVIVQGRMSSREFTDNQGQQRTSLDLEVEAIGPELRFHVAQPVRGGQQQGHQQAQAQQAWGQPANAQNPWGTQQAPAQQQTPPQRAQQPQAAPQQQQAGNPWQGQQNAPQQAQGGGQQQFGGGFDDEQPF